MLRLVPRGSDASAPARESPDRSVGVVLDRLYTEGRLTWPEADVLRRTLPRLLRDPSWPARIRDAVVELDASLPSEYPSAVERGLRGLDVPDAVVRALQTLRHHALLRLPDMGDRYQRLRAILVLLLVT